MKKHKENGYTEPLYGEKSKGVLRIVPQSEKCESLEVDEKCDKISWRCYCLEILYKITNMFFLE